MRDMLTSSLSVRERNSSCASSDQRYGRDGLQIGPKLSIGNGPSIAIENASKVFARTLAKRKGPETARLIVFCADQADAGYTIKGNPCHA
jgi:hypothetical protein